MTFPAVSLAHSAAVSCSPDLTRCATRQAQDLIAKHQPNYATSMAAYTDKRAIWDGLTPELLARPIDDDHIVAAGGADSTNSSVWKARRAKIDEQVTLWYRALAYEKKNAQHLDGKQLADRVRLVYRQALNCMRFLPDLWYDRGSAVEGSVAWRCSMWSCVEPCGVVRSLCVVCAD